jgi:hypothetical protein
MNNLIKASLLLTVCTGMLVFNACKAKKTAEPPVAKTVEPPPPPPLPPVPVRPKSVCDDMTIGYNSHIKAIIDANCARSCHSNLQHAARIDLSTYELVKYEAAWPRFMASLRHEQYYTPMPLKAPKLADSTLLMINCWIEKGAPL